MWTCTSMSSGCGSRTCSTPTSSRLPRMRSYAALATTLFALALAGCASSASGRSIASLEKAQRAEPGSFAVNRSLGIGYYEAGRFSEANAALRTAAQRNPNDATTALYLGLVAEKLGDLAAAKRAYSTYLTVGRTNRVRRQLQAHLTALTRRELAEDARRAVADERTLGDVPGSPTTVAVL